MKIDFNIPQSSRKCRRFGMLTRISARSVGLSLARLLPPAADAAPVVAAEGKMIDATKAGVVGDGTTMNTAAIKKVIDDCSAAGGGTISFPAGRYLAGTIQIKSNVTLRLEDQAILLGSTEVADNRNLDPFIDGSGNPLGHALIVAVDATTKWSFPKTPTK